MFRRDVRRVRFTAGLASLASAVFLLTSGVSSPAQAQTGLEQAVGPISTATRHLLPNDPKLWGAYRMGSNPDLCVRGSIRCVDNTIAGMTQRFNPLAATCSHSAVFSLLYLRVTEKYREFATPSNLGSPATVNREDTDFGRFYTRAFDRWYADLPATVPPIWRLAFAAADKEQVRGMGDALLGMAAHIKRDLPFALYQVAVANPQSGVSYSDHLAINAMLESVYTPASIELNNRFDQSINLLANVPGSEVGVVNAIATWRQKAWDDAQDLLAAPTDGAFQDVAMRIERDAWHDGLAIYTGAHYEPLGVEDGIRNAYCDIHHGTAS